MKRGTLLLVVAVLLVAIPAALLAWMRTRTEDRLFGLEPDPVPVVLAVELREITDAVAVSVVGTWVEPVIVAASAWHGLVTRVDVAAGDRVMSGDVVARVDAVDRVAVASTDPFWRPLRRRDLGEDVVMLQSWLLQAGFYDGEVDGIFGRGLQEAVKAWSEEIGVEKPDGSFDPGWVVWIPTEPFEVAEVVLERGSPAPSMGGRVIVGPTPLDSVVLLDRDGRRFDEEGKWVLLMGDVEVSVVNGSIGAEGLRTLNDVLDVEQPSAGRVVRAEPVEALVIPATAVVSNASGGLCVFVPDGDGFTATPVELAGGRVATVNVASGLGSGDDVLANPSDIFEAPSCP
jgi:peptidoglycan hydrolase-like protein with peptidoglycan-binding domain